MDGQITLKFYGLNASALPFGPIISMAYNLYGLDSLPFYRLEKRALRIVGAIRPRAGISNYRTGTPTLPLPPLTQPPPSL